jgi:hypothetical protein
MSWVLVVALLVIFVVRAGYSMVNRQRLRGPTGMTSPAQTIVSPAQRAGTEPAHATASAWLWQPDHDAPLNAVPEPRRAVSPQTGPAAAPALSAAPDDTASDDTEEPTPLTLPAGLEAQVRELMDSGFEAGAVRLICDELGVGILDAQQTAREVAGLATP